MLSLAEFKSQREEKKMAKLRSKQELEQKICEFGNKYSNQVHRIQNLLQQFEQSLASSSNVPGMEDVIERLETLIEELAHLQKTEKYIYTALVLEKLKYHC